MSFPKHHGHTEHIFYQLTACSYFPRSGCDPDLKLPSPLLVLPIQHHAGISEVILGPSVERGNYCPGPTKRTKANYSSRNYPWFEKQVYNVLSPHPECKSKLLQSSDTMSCCTCVLVHYKRCSSLQYLPHKKRFMISKNLVNGKAIIQSLFLQSCTSKQLFSWGFKNGKEKSPLLLFPNKDSIIKPFSLFSIYFPLMSGTGLNLQTSLDSMYHRDVHDSNCNGASYLISLARLQYLESL